MNLPKAEVCGRCGKFMGASDEFKVAFEKENSKENINYIIEHSECGCYYEDQRCEDYLNSMER